MADNTRSKKEADDHRTAELARNGYRVLHFLNNDVLDNLDGVLTTIHRVLDDAPPRPTSPRLRGGEE